MNQKEYLTSLGRILKDKKTKYPVKDKLAELIQSWGVGLQSSARFPNFFMTYQALRHAGVHFNPSVADYSEPPAPVVHRSASPQTLYANIFFFFFGFLKTKQNTHYFSFSLFSC